MVWPRVVTEPSLTLSGGDGPYTSCTADVLSWTYNFTSYFVRTIVFLYGLGILEYITGHLSHIASVSL